MKESKGKTTTVETTRTTRKTQTGRPPRYFKLIIPKDYTPELLLLDLEGE